MKHYLLLLAFIIVASSMDAQNLRKIWDFEDGEQSGWVLGNDGDSVTISTEFALSGENSLILTANNTAANAELINDDFEDLKTGDILTFMVYVPADAVEHINGLQVFWQDEGDAWAWNSNWFNGSDMVADNWNMLAYEIPEVIPPLNRIGLQLTGFTAEATPSIFIDDISIQRTTPGGENAGFWSWEDGVLGDWGKGVDGDTAFVTDIVASDGTMSVKVIAANNHTNVEFQNDEFLDMVTGDTIRFDIMVTSADQPLINGIQIFWQDDGDSWAWNSDWRNGSDLTPDVWQTLEYVVPEVIPELKRIGIQLVGVAAEDTPAMYLDNYRVVRVGEDEGEEEPERELVGFWGFEDQDLGNWMKGNDGDTIHVSDEQASEGMFSAKVVSAANHVNIEFQNDEFDNVQTGDTIIMDVFVTADNLALINGLQLFWQDDGENWAWNADWIGADKLTADAWTTFVFRYPEVLEPLNRIGLQMVSLNAEDTPAIYIDNIQIIGTPRAPITEATPVVLEAEEAGLGSDLAIDSDDNATYVYPQTNFIEADFPASSSKLLDFTVYFPAAGMYDLYAKVYVGPDASEDDSFFAPAGFGEMDTVNGTSWLVANNLQAIGFTAEEDTVTAEGFAELEVYKWINISALVGTSYEVFDNSAAHQFQIGAREDGLRIDKIAFGNTYYKYAVSNLEKGEDGVELAILDPGASLSFESEEATLGAAIGSDVEGETGYASSTVDNSESTNPGTADNVKAYSVKLNFAGTYNLYARVNVGPDGENDDAFYAANGFGEKDPTMDGDWTAVDGLSALGYIAASDIVDGAGEAGTEVYKWINISALTGETFDVEEGALEQVFQIGVKDDGLKFDKIAFGNSSYTYYVYQLDGDRIGNLVSDVNEIIPGVVSPIQAIVPNPFTGIARIDFELTNAQNIRIEVFNTMGSRVDVLSSGFLPAGSQSVIWNPGSGLSNGIYYIVLSTENARFVRKAVFGK